MEGGFRYSSTSFYTITYRGDFTSNVKEYRQNPLLNLFSLLKMLRRTQVFVLLTACVKTQQQLLYPQTDVWNSKFHLTAAQIAAANVSQATAHNVEVAMRYERTNNAFGLIQNDPFYDLPDDYDTTNPPPPGTVLKVEEYTNITSYTIPMSLSMSRFLYTTETLNGTSSPASAYVLWPYLPRELPGLSPCSKGPRAGDTLFPVIGLAHGTSGQTQACAPSGLRDLW